MCYSTIGSREKRILDMEEKLEQAYLYDFYGEL